MKRKRIVSESRLFEMNGSAQQQNAGPASGSRVTSALRVAASTIQHEMLAFPRNRDEIPTGE
jgi:hypothetical protein